MKKRFCLNEDKLPQSLFVAFSSKILEDIKSINSHNQDNIKGLYQWRDYLDGIQNYLSNPSIAFDYANRYSSFPNGAKFIRDFDYNVGYTVKTNNATNQVYVYIFMVNLKPEEFGLRIPKNENKQYKTNRNMKQVIRLTESDLHRVIKESVNKILNELDWRTYDSAAQKSREKHNNAETSAEQTYHGRRYGRFQNASDNAFREKFGTWDKAATYGPRNDREALGQAQYAIHKRGGDEYIPGKGYRKKQEA